MRVLLAFHSMVTRSNHRLAEELAAYPDIDLTVVAPVEWHEESRDVRQEVTEGRGYRLHVLPILRGKRHHPNLFVYRQGLARVVSAVKPDIIDLYEEPFSLAAAQLLPLRAVLAPHSKLVVYSAQNIDKRYPPPFRWIEQWSYRAAAFAHTCNSEAIDVLRHKGYRGNARVIPLGVDHERFTPVSDKEAAKGALGLQPHGAVIGYVGRLHSEKGVQDLLDAFALLLAPGATLLLVGDGPHRELLEARACEQGVADQVTFLGAIDRLALPPVLQAMDALVVPSRTTAGWKEQFGRVLVEAFLSGAPVVGSSSGSIRELIGADGVVYPEGDVAALAAAIGATIADRAESASRTERARTRALREYTWPAVAARRYEMYRAMLGMAATYPDVGDDHRPR
jgi:glycosyltransferase involved in cell wall biosynthesis